MANYDIHTFYLLFIPIVPMAPWGGTQRVTFLAAISTSYHILFSDFLAKYKIILMTEWKRYI